MNHFNRFLREYTVELQVLSMENTRQEAIVLAWYPKIYNYVYFRVLNKEISEDIVGDAFLKAMADKASFDDQRPSFGPWLYAITRNTMMDFFRKTKKAQMVSLESQEHLPGTDDPTQFFFAREDVRCLYSFLKQLSDKEREIIALRYWGGMSYAQIATHTGLSGKNVSVILTRAIAKLRKNWAVAM